MRFHFGSNGHGENKGKIAATEMSPDCTVFYSSNEQPVEEAHMPASLAHVIPQWMEQRKAVVRATLPIVKDGNIVLVFVWHEPLES
jgi:hypothetical protein